jgi:hypothetical protein
VVVDADRTLADAPGVRSATRWRPGKGPVPIGPGPVLAGEGCVCIDLVSGSDAAELWPLLGGRCPGLTQEMLADLLTPDDRPDGKVYDEGRIKLASTFGVTARRTEMKPERGKAMRSGVLVFQPVELLACREWLLTCWHPIRTFAGADKVSEGEPGSATAIQEVADEWCSLENAGAGDLGILIMNRLALDYRATAWKLAGWHEDWELSLYVDDALDNPEELPALWGMMAVLRDWLNPLNRPGLRKLPDRAWLPNENHDTVVAIDDRIDDTLRQLRNLADSMRASFSLLHVQTAEEERERKEDSQHRVELIATAFLVPTLVVGFYGANTWVPGQGRHWGFWVMMTALVVLTAAAVGTLLAWRRRERAELNRLREERNAARAELLRFSEHR